MAERRSLTIRARVAAAEATIARFAGKPLKWGDTDCLRMAAFCLRELGFTPPLREAGVYRSHLGAHKALKRTGCASVLEWVDRWGLARIPRAFALPGDIAALPSGEDSMPSLSVICSGARYLMFVPELGCATPVPLVAGVEPLAVWRA